MKFCLFSEKTDGKLVPMKVNETNYFLKLTGTILKKQITQSYTCTRGGPKDTLVFKLWDCHSKEAIFEITFLLGEEKRRVACRTQPRSMREYGKTIDEKRVIDLLLSTEYDHEIPLGCFVAKVVVQIAAVVEVPLWRNRTRLMSTLEIAPLPYPHGNVNIIFDSKDTENMKHLRSLSHGVIQGDRSGLTGLGISAEEMVVIEWEVESVPFVSIKYEETDIGFATAVTFQPHLAVPSEIILEKKVELVLLIDVSGSMAITKSLSFVGDVVGLIFECLKFQLKDITLAMNVVLFGEDLEAIYEQSNEMKTEDDLHRLQLFILRKLEAIRGSTNFLQTFASILVNEVDEGYLRNIVVLSDGLLPKSGPREKVVNCVRKNAHTTRVYPISLNESPFLRELASVSNGDVIVGTENLVEKTLDLLNNSLFSHSLFQVDVRFPRGSIDCEIIPPLSLNHSKTLCFFANEIPEGVLVQYKIEKFSSKFPVLNVSQKISNSGMKYLCAQRRINFLETEKKDTKDIFNISKLFNVVSRSTEYHLGKSESTVEMEHKVDPNTILAMMNWFGFFLLKVFVFFRVEVQKAMDILVMHCIKLGNSERVRKFLEDPSSASSSVRFFQDDCQRNIFHVALSNKSTEMIEVIVNGLSDDDFKFCANQKDFWGKTPGHYFRMYEPSGNVMLQNEWKRLFDLSLEKGMEDHICDYLGVSVRNYCREIDVVDFFKISNKRICKLHDIGYESLGIKRIHGFIGEKRTVIFSLPMTLLLDGDISKVIPEIHEFRKKTPNIHRGGRKAVQLIESISSSQNYCFLNLKYDGDKYRSVFSVEFHHNCKFYKLFRRIDMMKQLASLLFVLHENNVYHGNVRPSSILVDDDYHVVLTDFSKPFIMSKLKKDDPYRKELSDDVYAFAQVFFKLLYGVPKTNSNVTLKCPKCIFPVVFALNSVLSGKVYSMEKFVQILKPATSSCLQNFLGCCSLPEYFQLLGEKVRKSELEEKQFIKAYCFITQPKMDRIEEIHHKEGKLLIIQFLKSRIKDQQIQVDILGKYLWKRVVCCKRNVSSNLCDVITTFRVLLGLCEKNPKLLFPVFDILRMLLLCDEDAILTSGIVESSLFVFSKNLNEIPSKARFRILGVLCNLLHYPDGVALVFRYRCAIVLFILHCIQDEKFVLSKNRSETYVCTWCSCVNNFSIQCGQFEENRHIIGGIIQMLVQPQGKFKKKTVIKKLLESWYRMMKFSKRFVTCFDFLEDRLRKKSLSIVSFFCDLVGLGIDLDFLNSFAALLLQDHINIYHLLEEVFRPSFFGN